MPRILFLSESCLFDQKSGAAHSVRALLHALAAAGWQVRAATLSLCDGEAEYPLAQTHPDLEPAMRAGEAVTVADGAVVHRVQVAHSTRHHALRPWELRAYHALAEAELAEFCPDVVLSYSSPLLRPLLARAQRQGARTVFYLANAGHLGAAACEGAEDGADTGRPAFVRDFIDEVLVPSQALAALCRERTGIEARVLGDIVARPFDGRRNLNPPRIAARRGRYVTMVNPDLAKGGLFFINIAAQLAALDPKLRLRAVESRWGRAEWAARNVPAEALDCIAWEPATADMARIYDEAALLLVPSLLFEASGRVIAEALLAGVPVLAMRTGGIPEQVNDGGFLFDLPPALAANPLAAVEPADVQPWAQFVRVLMQNDAYYTQAVRLALQAATKYEPAVRTAQAVALFEGLLARPVLTGLPGDDASRAALQAQRARLAAEREMVNACIEAGETAATTAPQQTPYTKLIQMSLAQPALQEALAASKAKDWVRARAILEQYLRLLPDDIAALGLLAEVADAEEREAEARQLLERVLALAPGFVQGQQRLVALLQRQGNVEAALAHSFALIERAPHAPQYLALHAGLLTAANRFDEAIAVYEAFFRQHAGQAHDWMHYGQALKTLGRQDEAIGAYRKAIALAPGHGAAWHALANLKLAVFTAEDIAQMQAQFARADLGDEDQANLHFALGKAQEDRRAWQDSFGHYAQANRIRHARGDFDVGRLEDFVAQAKALYTPEFFAARAGFGDPSRAPVFVLGMHRAGSTLVEQILASHGAIEGTRELPHLLRISSDFGDFGAGGQVRSFTPGLLADLSAAECAALGRQYLALAAPERRTARPLFVDKMPANWMHVGLIQLLLPNARIVDIRRAPMAAGFALFKMNFGRGAAHAWDQRNIARYYRAYANLMAHFDSVLPGRVHHLRYENLVADTETEIRRLIAYCGLPFEDACLRYWETERAIQTPSSEQVRQPIYTGAVEQWRHYEPWLGPMREAFGELGNGS